MTSLTKGSASIIVLVVCVGCETTPRQSPERIPRGYVFYCDGAGGGGITNWSGGLRKGLVEGGYPGTGEIFKWNTGLGVVADQDASVQYKRGKARKMAQQAAEYTRKYPNAPLTFIGLSAGSAVVVYGLEEMPSGAQVDHAVLCGASISSTYDLTRALENLDGKMYVFTSDKDPVLGFLVPVSGTADRASGSVPSAGLHGFRMPPGATTETRQQYNKIMTIPWRPEYAKLGYTGGHTDVLSSEFVKAYIAPRVTGKLGSTPTALASREGKVRNPDYERWAKFGVGSYSILDGFQEQNGVRSPIRLKAILTSKSADRLMVERQQFLTDQDVALPVQVQSFIAEAWIDPVHHPITDPAAHVADLPAKEFTINGRTYTGRGRSIDSDGKYPDWGDDLKAEYYLCDDVPGHGVYFDLQSHLANEPFKFQGQVVDFKVVP